MKSQNTKGPIPKQPTRRPDPELKSLGIQREESENEKTKFEAADSEARTGTEEPRNFNAKSQNEEVAMNNFRSNFLLISDACAVAIDLSHH